MLEYKVGFCQQLKLPIYFRGEQMEVYGTEFYKYETVAGF